MKVIKLIGILILTTVCITMIVTPFVDYMDSLGLSPIYQVGIGALILIIAIKVFRVRI